MQTNPDDNCILFFSTAKFDASYPSTSFNLAKEFAKKQKVYYIDYPSTWKDWILLRKTDQYRIRKRALFQTNGIIKTNQPNLKIVVLPPTLPIHFLPEGKLYRGLLKLNENIILRRIKKLIREEKLEDYVFINSFNFHFPNVGEKLNAALKIYHCVDPVIMPFDVKHGVISERVLIDKSDIIICTSQQLYKEKKAIHSKTYFIPNAADINHSKKATEKDLPVHPLLKNIKSPIIGYLGNIEKRIDFNLVADIATMNPDKNFVFAGPVVRNLVPDFFFNIPNVNLVGRIPYEEMPQMLKGFDVAIIPFKIYKESSTVFPLKLFEYLGAGKPVVSSNFNPDLKNFTGNLVAYCKDAKSFSDHINMALSNDSFDKQKERINLAIHHTWESRAFEFKKIICNHVQENTKIHVY
jgi:teichuronic acid biosynthesis glycosyltransferase TuaH